MDLANWSGERKIRGRLWVAPWTHQSLENQGWKWVGTLTCGPRVRNVVNDPGQERSDQQNTGEMNELQPLRALVCHLLRIRR